MLCPSAMNHATTLRIMERLRADEFTYQVNAAGSLPLALHGLCSMVWRRRVYRSSQQVTGSRRLVKYRPQSASAWNWRSSVALPAPASERVPLFCEALSCCSVCLPANGVKKWLQAKSGSKVVLSAAQGETAAVDSGQAQDVRYEDVPYVLIYATVGNICAANRQGIP